MSLLRIDAGKANERGENRTDKIAKDKMRILVDRLA